MSQLEFDFGREGDSSGGDCVVTGLDSGELAEVHDAEAGEEVQFGYDPVLTAQCVEALQLLQLDALASMVVVEWNPRMRTTAGRAFWPCGKIELNPRLKSVAPEQVRRTLLHELAHLVAYARAGRRRIQAHGVEWKVACAELGIAGERATHSLPLPGRTMQRRWRYECPRCGEAVDRVRRMRRWVACYSCCKKHNEGKYHRKFGLVEKRLA